MIVCLIGHEKNLGILTLTDFLLEKLGKDNCAVVGWNYLVSNPHTIINKIKDYERNNKSVIIKYVIPRSKFSSSEVITYPESIDDLSDVIFRVPTYREEISAEVPKIFFKGEDNPIKNRIDEFYSIQS